MKKWSLFLIVVLLLSLVPVASMGVVRAESTSQRTVTITPTDDRWIDEGGYVDSNTYRLRVGTYRGSEERAYLKFNLSELGIPPEFIISATLNLYAYYHYGSRSKSHNITVYGVADSWNENSINWSNKPQNLTNALDWQLIGSVRKWYSWNVTDFVKSELNGDKVVSFMLHSNLSHESTKDYIYFSSKETSYTDEKPYLEIVYRTPISISSINVPKSAVRNQPFKINVILQNSKTLDENVTFLIYVDGQLFKNETILLKASSSKELSYEYTPQTLGTHQIKAEIVGYGTKYASVEVYENPSTIINTFSRYYAIRYIRQEPRVNELYEEFTNLTEQLKGYGVDLAPLSGDIERINAIKEEMENYHTQVPYMPAYLTTKYFILTRKAGIAQNKLLEELNTIIPVLKEGLEKAKAGGNVTLVSPTPIKVLIDNSHNQYYNSKQMLKLATNIGSELGWEVKGNDEPLTLDLLKEYDLVIIPNPREDITDEEAQAIKEYVKDGGALLILGDWYKYVNTESLNKVVEEFGITFNDDELMDDEKNSGATYFPLVGEFNAHPAMQFLTNENELYYNGDTLEISGNATWLIRGYETSYAVDGSGNVVKEEGSKPIVAAAVEVGKGRIVAYGSSKALSDAYYEHYIDSNWPFVKGVLLWLVKQS